MNKSDNQELQNSGKIHFTYNDLIEMILSLGGIKFWAVVMFPFYIGWVIGSRNLIPTFNCILSLIVIGPLLGTFTVLFNAYYDLSADRYNPRKHYTKLFEGLIEPETVLKSSLLFCLIGLIISCLVSITFAAMMIIIVIFSILYSHPRTRWKGIGGLDIMVNTIGIGIIGPIAGWSLSRPIHEFPVWFLVAIAVIIAGLYAATTASDYTVDKRFNINTTSVRIGIKNTMAVGLSLLTIGILLLFICGYLNMFPVTRNNIFLLWPFLIIQPLIYYWMTTKPTSTNIWVMLTIVAIVEGLGTTIFLVKFASG